MLKNGPSPTPASFHCLIFYHKLLTWKWFWDKCNKSSFRGGDKVLLSLFCPAFKINKPYSNYFISCMQMIKDLLQCHLSTIEVNPNVFFTQSLWSKLQFLRISFQQLFYIPYFSGSYNTCLTIYLSNTSYKSAKSINNKKMSATIEHSTSFHFSNSIASQERNFVLVWLLETSCKVSEV